MRLLGKALTFDDVLLVPAFSQVLPKDTSLATRLSRNITLNLPLVSAAMDTVTGSATAIAMAQEVLSVLSGQTVEIWTCSRRGAARLRASDVHYSSSGLTFTVIEGEVSVVAVVDTSGSMSDPVLEAVAGELRHLGRHHPVHVVECDCVVHRTYRFRGRLAEVEGRGGTDFRPPLERSFLQRLRPKPAVVIVFTDGCGPAPVKSPAVPVIWCLTPDGQPPVVWGRVVEMGPAGGSRAGQ